MLSSLFLSIYFLTNCLILSVTALLELNDVSLQISLFSTDIVLAVLSFLPLLVIIRIGVILI